MADKVIFIAPKLKELELVRVPMGLKDGRGNKIMPEKCHFTPKTYGTTFETTDPDVIKWLRGHEYMESSRIEEIAAKDLKVKKEVPAVVPGGIQASKGEAEAVKEPAPVESHPKGRKARVKK